MKTFIALNIEINYHIMDIVGEGLYRANIRKIDVQFDLSTLVCVVNCAYRHKKAGFSY